MRQHLIASVGDAVVALSVARAGTGVPGFGVSGRRSLRTVHRGRSHSLTRPTPPVSPPVVSVGATLTGW